jgi:hypothetical protein
MFNMIISYKHCTYYAFKREKIKIYFNSINQNEIIYVFWPTMAMMYDKSHYIHIKQQHMWNQNLLQCILFVTLKMQYIRYFSKRLLFNLSYNFFVHGFIIVASTSCPKIILNDLHKCLQQNGISNNDNFIITFNLKFLTRTFTTIK